MEKTAGEEAQVGRKSEKELTLGSQGTRTGICPNSSTLPGQDSRTPRRHLPSSPGMLQALDPCALPCPFALSPGGREAHPRPLSPDIQGRQHLSFSGLSFTQRPPDPLQLHPFRESMIENLLKVSAYMGQRLVSLSLICCMRRWSQGARRGLSLAGTTSKPQGKEGKSCPVSRGWSVDEPGQDLSPWVPNPGLPSSIAAGEGSQKTAVTCPWCPKPAPFAPPSYR